MRHAEDGRNGRKQGTDGSGRSSRKDTGRAGEKKACEFLLECGYILLATNFFSSKGELDIVALDVGQNELVGIEVKTWARFDERELHRVLTPLKKKRMMYTMGSFLSRCRGLSFSYIRFDVILLHNNAIHHYKDVF